MSRVLALLECEIRAVHQGQKTDLNMVEDIVTYCMGYPELSHRPQEDLVFRRLESKAKADVATSVHAEHNELNKLINQLAVMVDNMPRSDNERLDELVDIVTRFIAKYRNHMAMEEDLFPLSVESLAEQDWAELESQVRITHDPLFGEMVDRRFLKLREHILAARGR